MNNENQTIDLQNVEVAKERPMKWYKFMIYFGLWAGAVLYLLNAYSMFSGNIYAGMAAQVYSVYPVMKPVDMAMGVLYIGLAVLAIASRFALAKYKKSGPGLFIAYYAGGAVISILYGAAASLVIGQPAFDLSSIVSLALSAVMIVLNIIYFSKRKNLFVN